MEIVKGSITILFVLLASASLVLIIFFAFGKYVIVGRSRLFYVLPVIVSAGMLLLLFGHARVSDFFPSWQEYEGVITDKQFGPRQTASILVNGNNGMEWHYITNMDAFNKMRRGNYIIKKKGELVYRLVSRGDTTVFR